MRESLRDNNLNNRGNLPFDKVFPNQYVRNLFQGGEHFRGKPEPRQIKCTKQADQKDGDG
jgi:hypothetical protein